MPWHPPDPVRSHEDVRRCVAWCRNRLAWRIFLLIDYLETVSK